MSTECPPQEPESAERLVRRLSHRYALVLVAVALLVILDQVVIQPLLVRLNAYAPAINVAGRQRMLSQRLTKAALAMQMAQDEDVRRMRREELSAALGEWSAAHDALLQGDQNLGVARLDTPQTIAAMVALESDYRAMKAAAGDLLKHSVDRASTSAGIAPPVELLVVHEAAYLPQMHQVVSLLEEEAERHVLRLRICALSIASAVIVLLLVLGWFVVRPATRVILAQVDELESRVASRTTELVSVNQALQQEMRRRETAEQESRLLGDQLAHAARVSTMGHLTAGLAHEINQPLTAIANYAEACELMLDSHGSQQSARLLANFDQIKQAALRAGQIVRRMRNFVRPQSGAKVDVDLHSLIDEVAELCRHEAERTGVQVTLQLAADEPIVSADTIQIQQVLVNLIENAMHALATSAPDDRRIEVRTTGVDDCIEVVVADSGPGFSKSATTSVFNPFYSTKPDGLGIGLTICRAIVQQHGGRIWAQTPPRGASVCFQLPRRQSHEASAQRQAECICR